MKKVNKIRKIVTRIVTYFILVALFTINIQVGMNGKSIADLSLTNLSMGLFTTADADTVGGVDCGEACYELCGSWGYNNCISTICNGGSAHCMRQ